MQKQVMARGNKITQTAIVRIELVQAKNVWNYRPGPQETFYKIVCSMPNLVTTTRSALPPSMCNKVGQHAMSQPFYCQF
jgi:hypothetical protein